jgi:aryl carrier-like protein
MGLTQFNCISRKMPRRLAVSRGVLSALLLLCGSLFAADDEMPIELPQARHLAAALADEASRSDTQLTLLAVANLLQYGSRVDPLRVAELEARFREDRAWLDRLAGRFPEVPLRPSLLDPAAWFLARELDQQDLSAGILVSPLGPDDGSMLRQLFDRGDERLAATLLPEMLPRVERQAAALWGSLLTQLTADPALAALARALHTDWFDPWIAAEPPAPGAEGDAADLIAAGIESLRVLAGTAVTSGPPDALRLKRLRFSLLMGLPALGEPDSGDAAYLLALASAVDGLYRREYLAFTEALLWVAADRLLAEPVAAEQRSRIPPVVADLLPSFSNAYAGEFSKVDPRINSALAAVFDVMQYLQSATLEPSRLASLRRQLANAVAELVLLIPDMDYYFEQPVRERISQEIDICISSVADRDSEGRSTLSREQFEGCLESLVTMANEQVTRAELAGDPDGPFGTEQLRRELMLTPWQRINYVLGYLHDQHPTGCELSAGPLPNPLEWSSLATFIVWFAQQSPVYFQTPQNEARVVEMRQRGMQLLQSWVQQVDCISGAGNGLNDPISRGLADYRRALDGLVAGLRQAELDFRTARLKPGADVVLHGDAGQRTAFRSEELLIGPCDSARSCEMTGSLETTRALIGLFPDPYLLADQAGLGEVEICYDNMQWVNRRSEPVRAEDPHVANYFGQLSFDLLGRYRETGEITNVFGFNFVSPSEYHYLFGAASEEVLDDSCPVEWVGSRIVTPLGSKRSVRIVPDRLTYLAAARTLPSRAVGANWSRNEEWRDSFITGLDVTPYEYPPDASIGDRVNRHLQALYQAEQSTLYSALFQPNSRAAGGAGGTLFERLQELNARKALLSSYMNLFYPQFMVDSSDIRGSLQGQDSLLDRSVLLRFREANVPVSSINQAGLERLERFQALWGRQPEAVRRSGTNAISVAHAITRLNSLYIDFFAAPPREQPAERAVSF